ncbi:hypothetical protein [Cupriavidus sp. H18C1]|uniref:hypothetical protein n=1 Tax=Cupriavidus sp. H18C1 TaxID=3241601 RepID=UPI003BB8D57C
MQCWWAQNAATARQRPIVAGFVLALAWLAAFGFFFRGGRGLRHSPFAFDR